MFVNLGTLDHFRFTDEIVSKVATKFSRERACSKFEARNSKFETNPNAPNSKDFCLFSGFEPLDFEFVWDFDIWISDFPTSSTCLAPAIPA